MTHHNITALLVLALWLSLGASAAPAPAGAEHVDARLLAPMPDGAVHLLRQEMRDFLVAQDEVSVRWDKVI